MSSCVFQHVPFKQTTSRELRLKSKPWINPYIQKVMQYRDRLLRTFHRTHSKETEDLYKKFRNRVANNIRKSKVKYFHEFFTQNKGNMKKLWSDRLLRTFHRTHSKETEDLYKKFRNRVANNIRKSKVKYFHEVFTQNKGNMKNYGQELNLL